nr:hypothetical protein [Tanacetum cinerariifolium]
MPKARSSINEPTTHSNHVSLQSHSLPLSDSCDTNIGQASIPPSINQSQTQTSFPRLLINPHVTSVIHAQTLLSPQGDNHTQPTLPPSSSREILMNDINQLQDLSNHLAMHLSQRNNSSSPYSPNLPHTINLDQVEQYQQQQQQEYDAWEEETVIDEHEMTPKDEAPKLIKKLQNVDKRVLAIFDRARMKAILNDMLSNQFRNAEEYAYHLEQATNFMVNQIVWERRQEDIR